ncbi:MAG TPA: haloacid dehalogenase [Elusimicrobia bacterium]|nr:haloacid dehalogenase [Elusimicrobiota bacterium]
MKYNLLKKIRLIIYDFDGVMTDNKVIIDQYGNESVAVNRSDGLAIAKIKKMGTPQVILSTEKNPVVQKRAKKLGLPCIVGISDKKKVLEKYLNKNRIKKEDVAYIGNDINDLEVMRYVGFPIAPANAHPKVRKIAKIITKTKGGCGVIREFFDKMDEEV